MQDVAHKSATTTICKVVANKKNEIESKQQNVKGTFETTVVLATTCVRIQNGVQISKNCRALLDTGAQMGLITCECAEKLQLPAIKCNQPINGVAGGKTLTSKVRIFILPRFDSNWRMPVELFVMDKFCGLLPSVGLPTIVPDGITLADPGFCIPAEVQMLLGADVWAEITGDNMYRHPDGTILQETRLGYICFGRVVLSPDANANLSMLTFTLQKNEENDEEKCLSDLLQKFWTTSEPQMQSHIMSQEEEAVERHFLETHSRDINGRYIVQIPLKPNVFPIADSRNVALRRFHQLERKLQRDPELKQ